MKFYLVYVSSDFLFKLGLFLDKYYDYFITRKSWIWYGTFFVAIWDRFKMRFGQFLLKFFKNWDENFIPNKFYPKLKK